MIAVAGEANRKIFHNDRNLDLSAGVRILLGGIPNLQDINLDTELTRDTPNFIKRLMLLLQKERVKEGPQDSMFSFPRLILLST